MKRAQRRQFAKETYGCEWRANFPRLPGSLHPFKRISALFEEAKTAARARMSAAERLQALFGKGFWTNLASVLIPALEKRRLASVENSKVEFSEKDAALLKAGRRLMEYKSRGHGKGGYSPRFGAARSKYMPHQGVKECARRAGRIV